MEADSAREALTLLNSIAPQVHTLPSSQQMRFHLLQAKAMNKGDSLFTTDSVMLNVVRYYDRHGNSNDRLLAHYLLGCVYRDLGEAPKAIECYQDAVDCADTLSSSCDFKTLSCVYAQQAYVYKSQLLFSLETQGLLQASHFALLASDTINSIYCLEIMADALILTNKTDSAETILLSAIDQFKLHGYSQNAISALLSLIYLYVRNPERLNEAKRLMDIYESESSDFSGHGNLLPYQRQYYSYKGRYYEQIGKLDSAEYFYRKVSRPHMSYTAKDPMYRGLLSVYTKRHQADSIAKYAMLYCEANDSSIAIKDQETTAKMAAQYNYTRYQRKAQQEELRAAERLMWLIAMCSIAALSVIVALWLWQDFRRRRQLKQQELDRLSEVYEQTKSAYLEKVTALQQTETFYKAHVQNLKDEMDANALDIKTHYETSIRQQQDEIDRLIIRIQDLKGSRDVKAALDIAAKFTSIDIVKHIFELASKSQFILRAKDWGELSRAAAVYYPALMQDLHEAPTVQRRGVHVCLLTILGLRASDIAHFLNVKENVLSKIKSQVNKALFSDVSAKTLYTNLERRYGIFL